MKNKYLNHLIMIGKFTMRAFILQIIFLNVLMAHEGTGQKIRSVKEVKIDLHLENVTLEKAFKKIESKTNYHFVYNRKELSNLTRITAKLDNPTVEGLLLDISKQANVGFRQVNNRISVKVLPKKKIDDEIDVTIDMASVSGQVTDEEGEPLPGVAVVEKGTTNGTVTDVEGNFSLNVIDPNSTLIFSFIGYTAQEVPLNGRTSLDVSMKVDVAQLEEVVVIAYGTADKRSFTGSVGEISNEQIEKRSLTNAANALAGTIAGVQTDAPSGQPGSAPDIRIRGIGSYGGSSSPLYVVDGVPYDQEINNISTDDIESISVLKDASATALYGSRAANGVVMITTKKGEAGKPKLNFKALYGITSRAIPEYEKVNAREYYPLMWEAYRNSIAIPGSGDLTAANQTATDNIHGLLGYNPFNVADNQIVSNNGSLNPNASLLYDDIDWFDPITRNGSRQDYNLSYSGGSETTNFLVSVGYLDEKGYIINSDFERWSARMNINAEPLKWLSTGLNLSGTYSNSNNARTDGSNSFVNPFNFARNMGPIYPVYEHDPATGKFILDEDGQRVYDLGFGPPSRPSGASPGRHVVQELMLNEDGYQRTVISARTYAEAFFLKNFSFRANFAVDLYNINQSTYDNKIVGDGAPAGRASKLNSTESSVTLNQLLTYKNSLAEKHNIEILAGHESYSFVDNSFSGSRQGQVIDGNSELVNFSEINRLTSSVSDVAIESFLSRIGYDYNGKYFLSASARRDGSSRFSTASRWGNFYSVGASWRMETEPFISDISWVNALKLRTSYGEVGNDRLGLYPSQGLYDLGYNNASEPGYILASLSSPQLTWETNTQFDVGADFVLFGARLSGSLEYYNRISSDLLFEVPLPLSTGVESVPENIGTMYNEGFEIQLSGDVIRLSDFTWNLSINASKFKNEFTKLPQEEIINGTKKLEKGSSIYDFWLREYYGVNSEDGSPLFRSDEYNENDDIIIGLDTLTTDQSNARFHYAGSSIPDLFGGITNTFRYKGISLSILTTYQIGGYVYDNGYQTLLGGADYGDAIHKDALDRWQKPGDITEVPRVDVSNNSNSGATSDRWLTDATHLNIRQITLNYNFPTTLLDRMKISDANIYISAENVKLFSEREGLNVIQNFQGVTSNFYTPSRIFSIGLNVGI